MIGPRFVLRLTFVTLLVREGVTCSVSENCRVDCYNKGIGPEAPDLDDIIPDRCRDKTIPELRLDSNNIQSIPRNWLSGWRVQILHLGRNPLSDIEDGGFDGHQCTLQRLYLNECFQLVSKRPLTKGVFEGCACSLAVLNMDGTRVTSDDLDALQPLELLYRLHLHRNSLTVLPDGVFSHMKNLGKLFLGWNAIKISRNEQPFGGLTKLGILELQSNKLETASFCSFGKMSSLNTLVISDNPMVCNCTIWWLKTAGFESSISGDCWTTLEGQCYEPAQPGCIQARKPTTPFPGEDIEEKTEDKTKPNLGGPTTAEKSTTIAVMGGVIALLCVIILVVGVLFAFWRWGSRSQRLPRAPNIFRGASFSSRLTSTSNLPSLSKLVEMRYPLDTYNDNRIVGESTFRGVHLDHDVEKQHRENNMSAKDETKPDLGQGLEPAPNDQTKDRPQAGNNPRVPKRSAASQQLVSRHPDIISLVGEGRPRDSFASQTSHSSKASGSYRPISFRDSL